jgi:lipopolysaccharide biosynthesis glycosyltransferase
MRETEEINICFTLHDMDGHYSMYSGVMMETVLKNTRESIRFFLLHDKSVSSENKQRFIQTAERYNQHIDLIEVKIPDSWNKVKKVSHFTPGSLFRLCIPELLPVTVNKAIYIDSDVVVNINIAELWNLDMQGKVMLGKKDLDYDNPIYAEGVDKSNYINSGVLLIDVGVIREEYDFIREVTSFFQNHLECVFPDQDAINFLFQGKIGLLPDRFNKFTRYERDNSLTEEACIFHLVSDRPRMSEPKIFDRIFWETLRDSCWRNELTEKMYAYIDGLEYKLMAHRNLHFRIGAGGCVVIWGAVLKNSYNKLVEFMHTDNFYFVDRRIQTKSSFIDNHLVENIEVLKEHAKRNDTYIVIMAYNHYREIAKILENWGYTEYRDFCDVRVLIEK